MMNRAMHISAIPPRDWLVQALLVYDQVQVIWEKLEIGAIDQNVLALSGLSGDDADRFSLLRPPALRRSTD